MQEQRQLRMGAGKRQTLLVDLRLAEGLALGVAQIDTGQAHVQFQGLSHGAVLHMGQSSGGTGAAAADFFGVDQDAQIGLLAHGLRTDVLGIGARGTQDTSLRAIVLTQALTRIGPRAAGLQALVCQQHFGSDGVGRATAKMHQLLWRQRRQAIGLLHPAITAFTQLGQSLKLIELQGPNHGARLAGPARAQRC